MLLSLEASLIRSAAVGEQGSLKGNIAAVEFRARRFLSDSKSVAEGFEHLKIQLHRAGCDAVRLVELDLKRRRSDVTSHDACEMKGWWAHYNASGLMRGDPLLRSAQGGHVGSVAWTPATIAGGNAIPYQETTPAAEAHMKAFGIGGIFSATRMINAHKQFMVWYALPAGEAPKNSGNWNSLHRLSKQLFDLEVKKQMLKGRCAS